jgi:hypothetical protein
MPLLSSSVVVLVRAARIPQGFVGNALHRDVQIAGQHRGLLPR